MSRRLCGKYQQSSHPIKSKDGAVLTSVEEQLKRWDEHFSELLNHPHPVSQPDFTDEEVELQVNLDIPCKAEILKALKLLRDGRSAGPDGIPGEALRAGDVTSVDMFHWILCKVWENEKVPRY